MRQMIENLKTANYVKVIARKQAVAEDIVVDSPAHRRRRHLDGFTARLDSHYSVEAAGESLFQKEAIATADLEQSRGGRCDALRERIHAPRKIASVGPACVSGLFFVGQRAVAVKPCQFVVGKDRVRSQQPAVSAAHHPVVHAIGRAPCRKALAGGGVFAERI